MEKEKCKNLYETTVIISHNANWIYSINVL